MTTATGRLPRSVRRTTAGASLCALAFLSACSAAAHLGDGDERMRWTGAALPDEEVERAVYRSVPAFPELTAPEAARAWGLRPPAGSTDSEAGAAGWRVSVAQTSFGTSVRMQRECGPPVDDPEEALAGVRAAYRALGGDPATYEWFTVPDQEGRPRALGEPEVEGSASWATGIFTATVSEDGPCAVSGTLMDFERTGDTVTLPSAEDAFARARSEESLVLEGDYDAAVPTWTLESGGRVVPGWRFVGAERAIVMVDLGDGWETALDTRSYLEQQPRA